MVYLKNSFNSQIGYISKPSNISDTGIFEIIINVLFIEASCKNSIPSICMKYQSYNMKDNFIFHSLVSSTDLHENIKASTHTDYVGVVNGMFFLLNS